MDEQIRLPLEVVLQRFEVCGIEDLDELEILAGSIAQANAEGKMAAVEKMFKEMLMTPDLHAYYKAQAYAFLSTFEGYNRVEFLRTAAFWILKARSEQYLLGFTSEDLAEWMCLIFEHQDEAYEEAGWLDRLETETVRDGVLEATRSDDSKDSNPASLKMQRKAGGPRLYIG